MKAPLNCPVCDSINMPFQQGDHLFICADCNALYAAIPRYPQSGDVVDVVIYEKAYTLRFPKKEYDGRKQ
jgi:hypothetical protein